MFPFDKFISSRPLRADATPRLRILALNLFALAAWLWLFRGIFPYLAEIFTEDDFRTNQLVLLGILALIVLQVRQGRVTVTLDRAPRVYFPALIIAFSGAILYLLIEQFLDINTLSAGLFAMASYGLLGIWMSPRAWRDGLPAALLLVGVLPFGDHLQTFIGFPMRILTATLVRDGLQAGHIASTGVDTILILENGVSQVDLPCSGVKSLWTGMLFLTTATWLERRPINVRWLAIALLFAILLFVVNLVRVTVLVLVGQVAGWFVAAEMLHVPLGVLGFVLACAAVVGMLRLAKSQLKDSAQPDKTNNLPAQETADNADNADRIRVIRAIRGLVLSMQRTNALSFAPALGAIFLAMGLLYAQRPETGLTQPARDWEFPAEFVIKPMPLKPDEVAWLTRDGAESATRLRFDWQGSRGSMILIPSTTWRAHHRPERCFEVYGLTLDDSHTQLIAQDFPVRYVTLRDHQTGTAFTATYWFQSEARTTDDYGARIWADLFRPERWVLVSILFDNAADSDGQQLRAMYLALHDMVAKDLQVR